MQTSNTWTHPMLTKQENVIVVDYCDECLSDKEVADKRNISINTVQTHKKSIFVKFGINKITQLSKIYFTTFCMALLISISGITHTSMRMNFKDTRTSISRTSRRSRRRIYRSYAKATTCYFPISA